VAYQYHISLFHNSSDMQNVLTANPVAQRDTYFIAKGGSRKPDNNVLISRGDWPSYDFALSHANFIYTGRFAYCFWDTGKNQIAAVSNRDPGKVQLIYSGTSPNHVLAVAPDGTIAFIPEDMSGWVDLKSKGLYNIPGVPEASYAEILNTLFVLLPQREHEARPAVDGLSRQYTIGGHSGQGKEFLFGSDQLKRLSLEDPKQFTISWTNYKDVYQRAVAQHLDDWASELTSIDRANQAFWDHIQAFGTSYNLLILRRVTDPRLGALKTEFGASWQARLETVHREGGLYEIDLSIFEYLGPSQAHPGGPVRFNPATVTLLEMQGKSLAPVMIRVWSEHPKSSQIYAPNTSTAGAWLYALQAAKSSITLYGVWLGHVYHLHFVTAAMQKTMFETIPGSHPIRQLLQPQSDFQIAFNYVLLGDSTSYLNIYSRIAPPSCITKPEGVLKLADTFAAGREFFDDDPRTELAKNGLDEAEFSDRRPWDLYGAASNLIKIFEISRNFVTVFVTENYRDDKAVAADADLQKWMKASADPGQGNLRGLPPMNNRDALINVLTSLVYRLTAHGVARLENNANPGLSFVPNFPPCLQRGDIPQPDAPLSTQQLLTYLPNTGTIGDMLTFYFAFAFSKPYVPLIPPGGVNQDLYFKGIPSADKCNLALVDFRRNMQEFIREFNPARDPNPPKVDFGQWPRNIET
jgi:Lipoxygenase